MAKPLTEISRVGPGELRTGPKEIEDPSEESMTASRLTEPSVEPGQTEYLTLSPQKKDAAEAQLLEALARKRREVPPARSLSVQGRPGALFSLSAVHPSDTMDWLVSKGEYKDVLIHFGRPACRLPLECWLPRGYAIRALRPLPTSSCQEKSAAVFASVKRE